MLTTIIATVVVLGILIFVHELGHFLVAKWAGVRVLRFSLGFGPRIVSVTRGETEYCISAVPLGGYVKMLGEDAEEEVPEEDKDRSFPAQSVWKRIGIVLAGPSSNLLFAIIIFALVYAVAGIPQMTTEIGSVNPASPAEQAGLRSGDRVLTINAESVSQWDQLSNMIQEHGEKPLLMEIQRGEEVKAITVTPQSREIKNIFGESIKRPVIGISAAGKFNVKRVNPLLAGYYSLAQTWNLSKLFLLTVVKLIERVVPLQTLGGPLLIAQMTGQQAQEGILNLIYFTALISINLGILNLLPIPVLDGGHLFFFFIEVILGRPIDMKKIEMAQRIGMVFLIVLMIFVFYNDIMRLITGQPSPAP